MTFGVKFLSKCIDLSIHIRPDPVQMPHTALYFPCFVMFILNAVVAL